MGKYLETQQTRPFTLRSAAFTLPPPIDRVTMARRSQPARGSSRRSAGEE